MPVPRTLHLLIGTILVSVLVIQLSPAVAPGAPAHAAPLPEVPHSTQNNLVRVPADTGDLQQAIGLVSHGGVIEIQGGTYPAPDGGWRLNNLGKSFTMRAAAGQEVVLDGRSSTDILRFQNTSRDQGRLIRFEGLTFANGRSTSDGVGGGLTIFAAEAEFVNCVFRDNAGMQPSTGGGGIVIGLGAQVGFHRSKWLNNVAHNHGGGISVNDSSIVDISDSEFRNNATDIAGHRNTATGGALHIGNSFVTVRGALFGENRAGYTGGAIHVIGSWREPFSTPSATLRIESSIFRDNAARHHPSTPTPVPTEGGAITIEDQALLEIRRSQFYDNVAEIGGAISVYRSRLVVEGSYLEANKAVGQRVGGGFGGAISATSSEVPDPYGYYRTVNLPASDITLRDSIIRGSSASPAQAAGALMLAGDKSRVYGYGGMPLMGTPAENRARAHLENVVFYDTHVVELASVAGGGAGGAILLDLAHATMDNVLILDSHAKSQHGQNKNTSGGALAILSDSYADMTGLVVASSSSERFGGGLFVQGSEIKLRHCSLINNAVQPGIAHEYTNSYGAAIFSSPDEVRNLHVSGEVSDCLFVGNEGLPIFDDDRTGPAHNNLVYNGNRFHSTSYGQRVFVNTIGFCCTNVEELNGLSLLRAGGTTTVKSTRPNLWLDGLGKSQATPTADVDASNSHVVDQTTPPPTGILYALPPGIGNVEDSYFIAFAWSGNQASLNGNALTNKSGLVRCPSPLCPQTGAQIRNQLTVDGQVFEVEVRGPREYQMPSLFIPKTLGR